MQAEPFAQSPLLQISQDRVAVAPRYKESGPWPLRWGQVDGKDSSSPAPAMLQQIADPVGILEDPAPGQPLIGQR